MITRKFGKDFHSEGGALTLDPSEVCERHMFQTGVSTRTHGDGWTISGEIKEDYYYWVNTFAAHHTELGRVWGDFESEVKATSKKAYDHFIKHHPPKAWDYHDI